MDRLIELRVDAPEGHQESFNGVFVRRCSAGHGAFLSSFLWADGGTEEYYCHREDHHGAGDVTEASEYAGEEGAGYEYDALCHVHGANPFSASARDHAAQQPEHPVFPL
jgi:hypothetical protein